MAERKLTVYALAKLTGRTYNDIRRIVKVPCDVRISSILRLAQALNVPASELVKRMEEQPHENNNREHSLPSPLPPPPSP